MTMCIFDWVKLNKCQISNTGSSYHKINELISEFSPKSRLNKQVADRGTLKLIDGCQSPELSGFRLHKCRWSHRSLMKEHDYMMSMLSRYFNSTVCADWDFCCTNNAVVLHASLIE